MRYKILYYVGSSTLPNSWKSYDQSDKAIFYAQEYYEWKHIGKVQVVDTETGEIIWEHIK